MSGHWLTRRTGLVPTAPPPARLSERSVLDEAIRPSAPEPGPEVTFTCRGLAAGQHLIDVHDHYRAELQQVRDLLTGTLLSHFAYEERELIARWPGTASSPARYEGPGVIARITTQHSADAGPDHRRPSDACPPVPSSSPPPKESAPCAPPSSLPDEAMERRSRMPTTPNFAHVVFQTSQPESMRAWYCQLLDAHVVYEDGGLAFITFDEEHHRIALIKSPVRLERKTPTVAAMHHVAYTFSHLDDMLARYEVLRDAGIRPAVCIAHGPTTSMYYQDPDGNFVEMQVDNFGGPDEATAYMHSPEYAEDSVGPAFDPEEMLRARRNGATVEELTTRSWARKAGLSDPMPVLTGAR
ncbi:MAG TPA: VOC family protein [Streptosporangiaceae bacterium]|nr:VOC family protein [Streptosporangiaceae bacterium]